MTAIAHQYRQLSPWQGALARLAWVLAALLVATAILHGPQTTSGLLHMLALLVMLPRALWRIEQQPEGVLRHGWRALVLALLARSVAIACERWFPAAPSGTGIMLDIVTAALLLAAAALLGSTNQTWRKDTPLIFLDGLIIGAALVSIFHLLFGSDMAHAPLLAIQTILEVGLLSAVCINTVTLRLYGASPFFLFLLSAPLRLATQGIERVFGLPEAAIVTVLALLEIACWGGMFGLRQPLFKIQMSLEPFNVLAYPASVARYSIALVFIVGVVTPLPPLLLLVLGSAFLWRENILDRRTWTLWRIVADSAETETDPKEETLALRSQIDKLARLAHDLASPMQGLLHVQRLLEDARVYFISDRLDGHLRPAENLVKQMQAQLHGRTLPLRLGEIDLRLIIDDALEAVDWRKRWQRVEITTSFAAPSTLVIGDPTALRRIIDNLLSNALAVLQPGGRILVEIVKDDAHDNMLVLGVHDTGPGLTVDEQTVVFKPGVRFHDGPGLGLGLAIVSDLIRESGGSCEIRSVVGEGTSFRVHLPAAMTDELWKDDE